MNWSFLIYIKSFFRRFKLKSALLFSFPVAFFLAWVMGAPLWGLWFWPSMATGLVLFAIFINWWDEGRATGIRCRLCSFEDCHLLYPARNKHAGEKKDVGSFACTSFDHGKYPNIYYCPVCKNGFSELVLDKNILETQDTGHQLYENVVDTEYLKNIGSRHLTYRNIYNKHQMYFDGKDVLEIGCYYGAFLDSVKDKVKRYVGIEPSKHAATYLREKNPHLTIINNNVSGAIKSGTLLAESFDTVVMFDVIEHLPDPIATLAELRPLLRTGGHLIFATINIEASISLLLGHRWPWFMDMHYYYFSDRGYVDMLHRSGFVRKKHLHFPYMVKAYYFVDKVLSLISPSLRAPGFIRPLLNFDIPVRLGDTVMIIGQRG